MEAECRRNKITRSKERTLESTNNKKRNGRPRARKASSQNKKSGKLQEQTKKR